ncbi:MAG TPA: phosphoribosyltransferase family protein [Polyangiaceae bacterium]
MLTALQAFVRQSALRHAPSIATLLDVLAPRECAACGVPLTTGEAFCGACGRPRSVAPGEVAGVPLWVAGAYEPPLSLAIGRFKFERHAELAPRLAALLASSLSALALAPGDVFVPVPLHPRRLVERGFDQAALLAAALARATRTRFAPRLLERARATEQQARLGRDERSANVGGAFRPRARAPAGRVVLVDDVVTTGATIGACIAALEGAGCKMAGAVALARAGS